MDETQFWVMHRRKYYGPFDYQWSLDLYGIELLYQREKYGECCSDEEFFADLKPYCLPARVSEVATVVSGTVVSCIFRCIMSQDRLQKITENLKKLGLERYTISQKQ
ncbi:MAG: hypothetical protein JKY95_19210 [Planctomycetaceae bacterium]|nr:hypothetical protein [Planctomycetaceae bacterium]